MRLKPGVTLDVAETNLRSAMNVLSNARSGGPFETLWQSYMAAVNKAVPLVAGTFAEPDIAAVLQSSAYWHLLPTSGLGTEPNQAASHELSLRMADLQDALQDLERLKRTAARPGVPVVMDTNILLWWQQPGGVRWAEVLKGQGAEAGSARLVVPLVVIDELDRHKYGDGLLARRAATAIRYLERALGTSGPDEAVALAPQVTLEVARPAGRHPVGVDADLQILLCAADMDQLCPTAGTRLLTDDTGMRLRARDMGLTTMRLPQEYRKPGTAIGEEP
ncbi:PIN domain-containing protein [Streptomyces inhibens]|uniref:PIN domain-containing protein n=1 Tax=Streptomyces inhibens TaxID=2293571 RepID=UPI0037A9DEFA